MDRLLVLFERLAAAALALTLLFMFVLIFGNVVLRFGFSSGIPEAEELARLAFLWTTFLGAYLAVRADQHIGIAGLRGMLPPRHHVYLDVLADLIKLAVLCVVLVGAWWVFRANLGGRAPVSGAPVAIGFASVVVGTVVLIAAFVHRMLGHFHRGDRP